MMYFNDLSGRVYEDVKKANEAIESATREKEAFFATISHEIRNPLQSLLGSVELLDDSTHRKGTSDSPAEPEEGRHHLLEICRNCCAIVINMVSNVLDMSKIAAGMMQMNPVAADLRELAQRILRVSRSRAEGKSVQLSLECDPTFPPAVLADTQRVEQVLLNLVSNAIKFTGPKGCVVVKLSWLELAHAENEDTLVRTALSQSSWQQTIEFSEAGDRTGDSDNPLKHRYDHHGLAPKYQRSPDASCLGDKFVDSFPPVLRLDSMSHVNQGSRTKTVDGTLRAQRLQRGIVKIEVMDTGIGMSKTGVARLFRPYQQAEAGISRYALSAATDII